MKIYDPLETAEVLPFPALVKTLRSTVLDYAAQRIVCPPRLSVPLQKNGVMLSMPASADDIAIQKLVTICPNNRTIDFPTVFGVVMVCDALTGKPYFGLDGATVTGRRTAAMTVLATQVLHPAGPRSILLIGTGEQASHHVRAFSECFPGASIQVTGVSEQAAADFCDKHRRFAPTLSVAVGRIVEENVDLVVTLTTSKSPVYFETARSSRLIAGVGAFTPDAAEIAPEIVRASTVIVDDPLGATHEAGDIILAGVDWNSVKSLADAINELIPANQSVFYKSVGCAAWDLAACRVARQVLQPN
jgi:1-piperideine-2-carboxylate/1-pyrroline-2-carboxylate reductase [NAD(P)H]